MSSGAGEAVFTPTVGGVGDWGLGLGVGCYAVRYVGKFMQQKKRAKLGCADRVGESQTFVSQGY